jgi:pyrroline-5-carboxylate reductase
LGAKQQILLIGFGNMGQALVRGWLAKGRPAATIRVVDPVSSARAVATALGVTARAGFNEASGVRADIVVLAVKPNQLAAVLTACVGEAAPDAVFLSIAAGKTLAALAAGLGRAAVCGRCQHAGRDRQRHHGARSELGSECRAARALQRALECRRCRCLDR